MSFEVYLTCYEDGDPAGIEERRLREVFGAALIREEPEFHLWHLEYGSAIDSCDVFITRAKDDSSRITSLMVSRPITDERLWNALFHIMRLGNVVLYFPGGQALLFADHRAVAHFPSDMLQTLGQPAIVGAGAEILAAIQAA